MIEAKELDIDTITELESFHKKGLEMLNLTEDNEPKEVVRTIQDYVKKERYGELQKDNNYVIALGVLLGFQYVKGLNWHWKSVI